MASVENRMSIQVRSIIFHNAWIVGILYAGLAFSMGCRRNQDCSDRIPTESGFVQLTFLTPDGQNLYPKDNPLPAFNIDSLYVSDASERHFTQQKGEMPGPFATKYYVYSFGQIYNPATDADALVKERCKEYFIHYNSNDVDTLRLCYQVTANGCGLYYGSFKAFYRNQMIFQGQRSIVFAINITK